MRNVLLVLTTVASVASAQRASTASLYGRVTDATSGAPLVGAELVIPSQNARTTADSTGRYRFNGLAAGVFAVQVRRLGYEQLSQDVSVISGAENDADFRLRRLVVLDTIVANAPGVSYASPALRGFEERRRSGQGGYFIPEAVLRKSENRTLGNVMRRIPGVRILPWRSADYVAGGRATTSGHALGGGPRGAQADPMDRKSPTGCWVNVYVDGALFYAGKPQSPPNVSQFPVAEIAGVEYYAGGASLPAQFSSIRTGDCGVLLLWTREK